MEVTNNVMMTRQKIWWEQFRDSPCQQNKTKLVVVRFYLYKRGASLKYSLVERSEYFSKALTK